VESQSHVCVAISGDVMRVEDGLQLSQLVCWECDAQRPEILIQVLDASGAWDGNDILALSLHIKEEEF